MILGHILSPIALLVFGSTYVFLFQMRAEAAAIDPKSLASKVWRKARLITNLGSTFGSATHAQTPYDRVMGHSVFQITTPTGASYLTFEQKLKEPDDEEKGGGLFDLSGRSGRTGGANVNRGVGSSLAVFYMDPADALCMREEMKSMKGLKDADLRITASSFARALRQSANFGMGLPTGQPVDPYTGKIPDDTKGGFLRYKIYPSARELYYAARCVGRERVGLYNPDPAADADLAARRLGALVGGNDAAQRQADEDAALEEKSIAKKSKGKDDTTDVKPPRQRLNKVGVPVFYTPMLQRRLPLFKQLTSGNRKEKTFFMSYEDLEENWNTLRKKHPSMPKTPVVEVFNLLDVLTAMDKEQNMKPKLSLLDFKDPIGSIKKRFADRTDEQETLQDIMIIPPSYAARFKERLRAQGNGKARLRPMR